MRTDYHIDIDMTLLDWAAAIKVRGWLGYADVLAQLAASALDCPVAFSDPVIRLTKEFGLIFRWLFRRSPSLSPGSQAIRTLSDRRAVMRVEFGSPLILAPNAYWESRLCLTE